MTLKVLNSNAWKEATPKGVLDGGAWVTPKKMYSLDGGEWKLGWEEASTEEPPYLYACDAVYKTGYLVDFTARIGAPEDPEDAFMFRCVQMGVYAHVRAFLTGCISPSTLRPDVDRGTIKVRRQVIGVGGQDGKCAVSKLHGRPTRRVECSGRTSVRGRDP
jgi:hypothetical protein